MEVAEERTCFMCILPVSWQSFIRILTSRSCENKIGVTTENKSGKSSTNIYTHPTPLSFFYEIKIR